MKVKVEVIKTVTEEVDIDVDISGLGREWKWLAVDKNGAIWIYKVEPRISDIHNEWECYPLDDGRKLGSAPFGTIENWEDTLTKIRPPLPVGTLVVLDSEILTRGSHHGLIVGVITSNTRINQAWPYECKCIRDGEGSFIQTVAESAIVAAYDPVTHEQLI